MGETNGTAAGTVVNGMAQDGVITIKAPDFRTLHIAIEGTAPLVIARFAEKAMRMIEATQKAGSTAKGKRQREAKDFNAEYEGAKHVSTEGWYGIHAAAFRNGSIDACRAVGYKMTHAKLAIFVEADGFDCVDGVPLVRITHGMPEPFTAPVRNATGVVDLRTRPMWREWGALLRIKYDADMFQDRDVINLIDRVGVQVGVGEGRPYSKQSAGLGFGTFRITEVTQVTR